ncbi:DUF397 domain-containing protein [Actinocorallia sp. API 0066]|uniref:DUF397 domain-containing protein n=1 Tax=Actinocorallia sp. API 0066 TaxID=2896846 RepID=UPI001E28ED6F|nr:DUF397 domain-containing protein [Actinocorallia sp. API 0066]MCD0451344.1 DUF397 domain-containing protein [Actinocorallia sp. API 0066]
MNTTTTFTQWRKSSYSGGDSGMCVEVAWRKSSHSGGQTGQCVEVGDVSTQIGIRDSKHPNAGHLTLTRTSFTGLINHVKSGTLEL